MPRLRLPEASVVLRIHQQKPASEAANLSCVATLNADARTGARTAGTSRGFRTRVHTLSQTWREPLKHWTTLAAAGFIAAATLVPAQAADISGAGATFPYPIYAKWADAYKKETGVGMNYQSIGSGGGIKQIEAKTVTFGATDAPLKGAELDKFGLVQFPMVMGGIVPVVTLAGVKPGELVLDGPTLAAIFLGTVKSW